MSIRHGHSRRGQLSPTYVTWLSMVDRCRNPSGSGFHKYGARGITVCDRWQVFDNFLADMGERPEGRTIDRINNSGNYEPGNCRWATLKEQAANRRPPRAPLIRKGWKLDADTVRIVRSKYASGTLQKHIAEELKLSKAMVCLIVNRKCWVNVQ